jgi:hypothetical protein
MTELPQVESHSGSQRPVWSRSLLVLVFVTIALIAFIAFLAAQPGISTLGAQTAPLPIQLSGQPMTAHSRGVAAVNAIEELHGRGFGLTAGEVAQYGTGRAWIAQTRNDAGARAMIDNMTQRIAEGHGPYTPTGTRQLAGHTVYALTGQGQSHFYWQSGSRVVWLAVDPAHAERDLMEMVTTLNGGSQSGKTG